jgi:hypothetical protein
MSTVTIGANTFNVYGDQASATAYLSASLSKAATAWAAATTQTQASAMVMAARMLDRQTWQGTMNGGPLQWPRASVVDKYGTAVNAGTIPTDILNGSYELAAILLSDPALQDQINNTFNIHSFSTGPASVTYFGRQTAGRFPMVVQELVGPYMARMANQGGALGSDTSGASAADDSTSISQFNDVDTYGLSRGT